MARRFPSQTTYLCCAQNIPKPNHIYFITKQQCLSLLSTCSSMKKLNQLHAQILTSGFHGDGFVISEVLRFCALSPSGSLSYARLLLFSSLSPITSSWNHVIRAYARSPSPKEAISVFIGMRNCGRVPNELTFPFLFKACSSLLALKEGRQIQVEALKSGVDSNVYVQNSMIHFYGSCQQISDARLVFDRMSLRTVVSWNTVVTACVENSMLEESLAIFAQMRTCGFDPDETTMVILLSACAELGNLSLGRWFHCQVIVNGLTINCQLGTSLVDMYAKCGDVHFASLVFDRMLERNVWTWSAMILGYAQHGFAKEALQLFKEMKHNSIQPNYVTFLGVLSACSHARMVDEGLRVFNDMTSSHGIKPMMIHYGAMVDIFSRSGQLKEAYNFIMDMPIDPDPVVWRTLLSACSNHDVNDSTVISLKVKERLLASEPKRGGNLVIVANMYAEVGSWEEAAIVRRMMKDKGVKKIAGESCVEVGGLLCKFLSGDDTKDDYEEIYHSLGRLNLHMKTIDRDLICFP